MALTVGEKIGIRCKVQPGPFSDEPLITVESVEGPISGFVKSDELKEEPGGQASVQGVVRRIERESVEVWMRGSFFTTNGIAHVRPELAMAV